MLSLSDNPPILSPLADSVSKLAGTWWVAHTKARAEKAFAWDLHGRRIGYFLPMALRTRVSGGRKRKVMMPVFPSYVFFCGDDKARYDAMTTDRLCQTIEVNDQAKLVAELSALERALAGNAELGLYTQPAVGQRYRVTAGTFAGVEGIVVSQGKKATMVLQVSMLGQGASLEIETDLLELVDAGARPQPVDKTGVRVPRQ